MQSPSRVASVLTPLCCNDGFVLSGVVLVWRAGYSHHSGALFTAHAWAQARSVRFPSSPLPSCVPYVRMGLPQVDMPVLFFVDPSFCDDPRMDDVASITLSYTFFESKDWDD